MDKSETMQGNVYVPTQAVGGRRRPRRDRGFWLLRTTATRRDGWKRVRMESMEDGEVALATFPVGKRAVDMCVAAALLVLLAPVLMLLAMCVLMESEGPALFVQERVGEGGRRFRLWKLRSMYCDAPPYACSPTTTEDPRLTRMGRVIRRTSLDELPQLWNVLRGEMSLVGPRPEMPFVVESYTEVQKRRLACRPGMTGLWQISEGRLAPIHENLEYDLHYLRHRNVMLDAAILLRTVVVVLSGKETV